MTVAAWKIKNMLQAGKTMEIMNELDKYNIDITALREIRWTGQGRIDKNNFDFICNGPNMRC